MDQDGKKWNPKGGRPKKAESALRNKQVIIKFTAAEKEGLYKECEELGWQQPLVYFRHKLLSKSEGVKYNPQTLFKALDKLNPELNRVGNNINQVAKYVNHLDKNNMIDPHIIAEYNALFKKMTELQHEYTLAIRAYLRTLSDK